MGIISFDRLRYTIAIYIYISYRLRLCVIYVCVCVCMYNWILQDEEIARPKATYTALPASIFKLV